MSNENSDKTKNTAETKETKKCSIFDTLQEEIQQSDLPESEKNRRLSVLLKASTRQVNLMLVGATGSGKSSTINALFDMSVAKVGVGVDPETPSITKFELGNLIIWDTPGLGDTIKKDKTHTTEIVKKLSEIDVNGDLLIDLVLVVLDAGSKDLAISYNVINNALIPCLGKESNRILIAINQADMAMKGRNWDSKKNAPEPALLDFLNQKVESVKRRVKEATGVEVNPIYYCAGYTDGKNKQIPYNLSKLLYYILMSVPSEKRLILADNLNTTEDNWVSNDADYSDAVKKTFWDSLLDDVMLCIEKGAVIGGCAIGVPGAIVGGLIGAIVGGLRSLIVKPLMKSKAADRVGKVISNLL